MDIARATAQLSPDEDTQVGAIMLSPEGRIIASSFNGFLRKASDKSLPCNRKDKCAEGHDKYYYMQHAERNLIYNCSYSGIATKNTAIICTLSPCADCLRASYQSGVTAIVFEDLYHAFGDDGFYRKLQDVCVTVEYLGKYTILHLSPVCP